MNRIDRLHAILTHLQSKKRVTAQEIADRFNISLRTVYRDVKALDESGVPVIGEAGSGYSIMEGYRLPPVMFTQEEAGALLMGSKLAEQLTDDSVIRNYSSALYKIKAVLRGDDKAHVEALTDHIEIMASRIPKEEASHPYLAAAQKAIVDKKVLFLRYSSINGDITERKVEPIGLCYYSQGWHMIGWCRLRNGYRDFRLTRMQKMIAQDEVFNSSHPSIQEYIKTMTTQSELIEVVVDFNREACPYISSQKYYYGFVTQEECGEFTRMKFVTSYLRSFAHWLLMFTDKARVESPVELNEIMLELVAELKEHYYSVRIPS